MKQKKADPLSRSASVASSAASVKRPMFKSMPSASKKFENPFDKFANARKKHEVINRRIKGEDRNVGRARKQAIESRKHRLLQDYQTSKKSNTFADRRFGENEADLSLEDKMFLRFQKEKLKKARNASIFNLDGDSEVTEMLTHKGQILGENNMADDGWRSESDDENGGLGKDVVNKLHFGGGMVEKMGTVAIPAGMDHNDGMEVTKKSRLDALQEIVAKSKMFKAQKKEAKEEQENERERLDKAFEELVSGAMVKFQPTKRDRSEDKDEIGEQDDLLNEYDQSLRAMAFEGKAQPTDRTKSAEELAIEARKKLEDLEAARLRRMNANHDPDDEGVKSALSSKTRRNKKDLSEDGADDIADDKQPKKSGKVHITDDEVDGSFGSSYLQKNGIDEEVGDYGKLTRRMVPTLDEVDEGEDGSEGESDDESESEDSSEDGWEDDDDVGPVGGGPDNAQALDSGNEDDDHDDDDEEDEEEEEEEEVEEDEEDVSSQKKRKNAKDEEDEDDDGDDMLNGPPRTLRRRTEKAKKAVELLAAQGVNDAMPHNITCPATIEEFNELKEKYVKCSVDFRELISRILAWNSVHLPGQEGVANRGKMHNFLDILLKVFVTLGDGLSVSKDEKIVLEQLDFLCTAIFKLCQDISDSCGSLWGRTLKLFERQLQKRMRDVVQGVRLSSWPSLGQLLLFRQLGHVFSVSDYQHAIVGSASMFLCQCLTQCAVRHPRDVACGLLASSVLIGYTADAGRLLPEVIEFLRSVLSLFIDASKRGSHKGTTATATISSLLLPQKTFDLAALSSLRTRRESNSALIPNDRKTFKIPWTCFSSEQQDRDPNDAVNDDAEGTSVALFATSQTLLSTLVDRHAKEAAFPEIFAPVLMVLRAIRPQDPPELPRSLQETHLHLLEQITSQSSKIKRARQPLQWRRQSRTVIESKNPRFQVDYTFKKDIDPNSERAKLKQLTRQAKREKKAAMRELRRDSDFLDQQRFREQQESFEARKAERHKNFAFMEEQQATINQQVRKGGGLLKGGGSGIAKKARLKR